MEGNLLYIPRTKTREKEENAKPCVVPRIVMTGCNPRAGACKNIRVYDGIQGEDEGGGRRKMLVYRFLIEDLLRAYLRVGRFAARGRKRK